MREEVSYRVFRIAKNMPSYRVNSVAGDNVDLGGHVRQGDHHEVGPGLSARRNLETKPIFRPPDIRKIRISRLPAPCTRFILIQTIRKRIGKFDLQK